MYGHLCIVFWNDMESLGEMVSLGKTPELYLEQVSLYYAYRSTAMYTQVLKRPSVPEKRRRCNSNLLEGCPATNIATWNVRTISDENIF